MSMWLTGLATIKFKNKKASPSDSPGDALLLNFYGSYLSTTLMNSN